MDKTDDAFIICQSCKSKNASDATHCAQCRADLLPGRSVGMRVAGAVTMAVGAVLMAVLWEQEISAVLWYALCMIPIGMAFGGFKMAFGKTPLYERYVTRAERHLQECPNQAVLDFTRALAAIEADDDERYDIYEQRGDALANAGRYEEARADYEAVLEKPEPPKGIIAAEKKLEYGLWEGQMKRVRGKIAGLKQTTAT